MIWRLLSLLHRRRDYSGPRAKLTITINGRSIQI